MISPTDKVVEDRLKDFTDVKFVRVPKVEIIGVPAEGTLKDEVNNFLVSICTLKGFEFNGFDIKTGKCFRDGYVGVITYSYEKFI